MFHHKLTDEDTMFMFKMNEILSRFPNQEVPKQPTQLLPHVFIGNLANAESISTLRRAGITYVLNCGALRTIKDSPYKGLGIEYHGFLATDNDSYDISNHFGESFSFLDNAKRKGAKVLVHCAMGINRSAAICAAYIMKERNMTLLRTMEFLKVKRPVILTNIGFRYQLLKFARKRRLLESEAELNKALREGVDMVHLANSRVQPHVSRRQSVDHAVISSRHVDRMGTRPLGHPRITARPPDPSPHVPQSTNYVSVKPNPVHRNAPLLQEHLAFRPPERHFKGRSVSVDRLGAESRYILPGEDIFTRYIRNMRNNWQ